MDLCGLFMKCVLLPCPRPGHHGSLFYVTGVPFCPDSANSGVQGGFDQFVQVEGSFSHGRNHLAFARPMP